MKPIILLSSMVGLVLGCSAEKAQTPNIVLILADDMGYGDASCYNPESKIQTPNIDKLASQGIHFTDAHSPSSLCTPTRYGLLTGRYCWRTRLQKGVILGYDEEPLIEPGQANIASLLKERGYKTACIGKWHLGMTWQTRDGYVIQDDHNQYSGYSGIYRENEEHIDFSKPILSGPLDVGFDYFYGTQGCSTGDPPYCFIENNRTVGIPNIASTDEFHQLPGFAPGLMVSDWSEEMVDVVFTEKAIAFIEKHLQESADSPFFLYLALSSPHLPWLAPDFAKGKSEEGPRGDLVTVVDWSVGQIMEALKKYALQDHTLLIFTSDNGPRKGANGHRSAGEFRGYKANIWEGGHRVPFIARWPGNIKPGGISNEVLSLTDLFATFDFLTQTGINETFTEDGYNVWPAFTGLNVTGSDTLARIFHSGSGVFAVRRDAWILIEGTKGSGSGNFSLPPDSLQLTGQLYNLGTDPGETNDLWDKKPDMVKELTLLLAKKKQMVTLSNSQQSKQ